MKQDQLEKEGLRKHLLSVLREQGSGVAFVKM
jgi:hypothetical protein